MSQPHEQHYRKIQTIYKQFGFCFIERPMPTLERGDIDAYDVQTNSIVYTGVYHYLSHEFAHVCQPGVGNPQYFREDGSLDHEQWMLDPLEQQANAVALAEYFQGNGKYDVAQACIESLRFIPMSIWVFQENACLIEDIVLNAKYLKWWHGSDPMTDESINMALLCI